MPVGAVATYRPHIGPGYRRSRCRRTTSGAQVVSTSVNGPDALLAVQDRDTELDQLRHRRETFPQRAELRADEQATADLTSQASSIRAERDELERRRVELDREVRELDRRIDDLDRRLKSGEVTATRELSAMVEQ